MIKNSVIYISVFLLSACIICFEIVTTRISSVIFVSNYAYIILSLAILGLGMGGVFSYYRIKTNDLKIISGVITKSLLLLGVSLVLFICIIILFKITNPYLYFFLLFFPFFIAGSIYAQIFKIYANQSFLIYAFDLLGAATGSVATIFLIDYFGASNGVFFLALLILSTAMVFGYAKLQKMIQISIYSILLLIAVVLILTAETPFLGRIPIGNYPEKDFYYVYPDAARISEIVDSRWSIHGRADLVQYTNQDMVKQLFIDGAAGTQMFRFNGDQRKPGNLLASLLTSYSTAIPIMMLKGNEKNSMLVIGPGGGKEVLTGLLSGVDQITGVEINPDFINIVKSFSPFNGGIYTNFPNIHIYAAEGRHFIKKTQQKFDVLVMALPSTEQLQNIDNMAMSENYLLTREAITDYLNILTAEGKLIITVHNRWEMIRLLITTFYSFRDMNIKPSDTVDHIMLLADDYAPTIVIKKKSFSGDDVLHIENMVKKLPQGLPAITFLPYHLDGIMNTPENLMLKSIKVDHIPLEQFINQAPFDIAPVSDDSPYFYKINKGIPHDMINLLYVVIFINILLIIIPGIFIKKKSKTLSSSIVFFSALGAGFMMIEVSVFQKLILYLGSPTIALSILLCALLVSMGLGSYFGNRIHTQNITKRIQTVSLWVLIVGILFFFLSQYVLTILLSYELLVRAFVTIILIFPFGFLLGIIFPSCIQLLNSGELAKYIPWMYGLNGTMSVLGSILAVVLSMSLGFTPAFFIGLLCYFIVYVSSFQVKLN